MLRNTSRGTAGRLLVTGQQVLPEWKLLCFSLGVLSNRLEKEQSCTEKQYISSSKHWETERGRGKEGKEAGRNWKPKRQFGRCQGTSVG